MSKEKLKEIIAQPDSEKYMQELSGVKRGKNPEIDNSVYKSKRLSRSLVLKGLNLVGIKK